jgi:hypothetical protein
MLYSPGGVAVFVSRWWEQALAWGRGEGRVVTR